MDHADNDFAGVIMCRVSLSIENHSGMVQDVIDKIAVGSKAGIIPILDVISGHLVSSLIGAFA